MSEKVAPTMFHLSMLGHILREKYFSSLIHCLWLLIHTKGHFEAMSAKAGKEMNKY